jgi:hypothetical protein
VEMYVSFQGKIVIMISINATNGDFVGTFHFSVVCILKIHK